MLKASSSIKTSESELKSLAKLKLALKLANAGSESAPINEKHKNNFFTTYSFFLKD